MCRVKHTLHGSTLAETLVMMLVAGIVFLAAMDALTLLSQIVARRTALIVDAGRQSDGIFRIGLLLSAADSVRTAEGGFGADGRLHLYHAGRTTTLEAADSAVLFVAGQFRDTLLQRTGHMRLVRSRTDADTLEIDAQGRTLKFPLQRPARIRYETTIAEIENGYGYDDEKP